MNAAIYVPSPHSKQASKSWGCAGNESHRHHLYVQTPSSGQNWWNRIFFPCNAASPQLSSGRCLPGLTGSLRATGGRACRWRRVAWDRVGCRDEAAASPGAPAGPASGVNTPLNKYHVELASAEGPGEHLARLLRGPFLSAVLCSPQRDVPLCRRRLPEGAGIRRARWDDATLLSKGTEFCCCPCAGTDWGLNPWPTCQTDFPCSARWANFSHSWPGSFFKSLLLGGVNYELLSPIEIPKHLKQHFRLRKQTHMCEGHI